MNQAHPSSDAAAHDKPVSEWSDAEKTAHIKKTVTEAGERLRKRHPWLAHQNAIAVAIMTGSLLGMAGSALAYGFGLIPWYVCVPLIAFFASLIHELEHDLIHFIYFRKKPKINTAMLMIGWLVRPSTINPLVRRRLHMHHHKHSGTESDLEERGITNGERWGLRRLLMTGDNMLAVFLRPKKTMHMVKAFVRAQDPDSRAEARKIARAQRLGYFPIGNLYYLFWHGFLVFSLITFTVALVGHPITLAGGWAEFVNVLDFLAVVLFLPCLLRTFCLHFISSNMHYFGDVQDRNIMMQTQVLNAWWLFPFQLFCCNFGSTHSIHHFVVKEPFYVRQWTAPQAHRVMREMGVRFNDFASFARANRYYESTPIED